MNLRRRTQHLTHTLTWQPYQLSQLLGELIVAPHWLCGARDRTDSAVSNLCLQCRPTFRPCWWSAGAWLV